MQFSDLSCLIHTKYSIVYVNRADSYADASNVCDITHNNISKHFVEL